MANYKTLRKGSSDSAATQDLQGKLDAVGYGSYLGNAGADGIFGKGTDAGVRAFQRDYGLQEDGIAGPETWTKLMEVYNSKTQQTTQQTTTPTVAAEPEKTYRYDAENDPVYQAAVQKVQDLEGARPTIQGTFDEQVEQLFQELQNQKEFSYDLNGDALWQQYKDQYTTQGKLAMMDTMGQAAALTGGYGSSYAQGVGQQAYQGYLQQLNDRVPELYQLAMQKYNNDQALLQDKFSAAREMQADEYAKDRDAISDWYTDLGLAKDDENTAYERGENSWYTEEQLRREDEDSEYTRRENEYSKLANLIASTGHIPSQEELVTAGMTREEAEAIANQYNKEMELAYSSNSSSRTSADPEYIMPEEGGYEELSFKHLYETAGEQAAVEFADGLGVHPAVIGLWISNLNPDQWLDPGA